ncbi:hypothetical protein IJI55_02795 [Candidatus Saccharibacteria bacterium]|nr:hypothetical protein [Candidatus Saccharibacteria bacterium]
MYDINLVVWFSLRIIPLAVVWLATLSYIVKNEYDNCHINWQEGLVEENETRPGSRIACVIGAAAASIALISVIMSGYAFRYVWMRSAFMLCFGALVMLYVFIYDTIVDDLHKKCVARNQPRLARLLAQREADKRIYFSRKYNHTIEPKWMHVVMIHSEWIRPQTKQAEIIKFPQQHTNN